MRRASLILAALTFPAAAEPHPAVAELCEAIRDNYVFPDVGQETADHIKARAEAGAYDDLGRDALASALTRDLQAFTKDRHFGVRALPADWTPPPPRIMEEPEGEPALPDPRETAPHGVHSVQRLPADIAYLDLRSFDPAPLAHDSILAAVRLMQGAPAVIVDLRHNGGGDPATVQLLCSYFFDPAEPLLLNSLYFRPSDETTEYWTNAEHPELCMPDAPVYVLTSPYTFSGAEEFSYNLQTQGRATIVGETTGGGAHPVNGVIIGDTLRAIIPVGRAINPITNTNWEGTGVTPDIRTPADQALDTALNLALNSLAESGDPDAEWGLLQLAARDRSFDVGPEELAEYAGTYTDREIRTEGDRILYRRIGAAAWRTLIPVADDVFMIDGLDDFRMRFLRGQDRAITAIRGEYAAGHSDESPRSGTETN